MFRYEVGYEIAPGYEITGRAFSPISGSPVYYVNGFDTPFFEDEIEGMGVMGDEY